MSADDWLTISAAVNIRCSICTLGLVSKPNSLYNLYVWKLSPNQPKFSLPTQSKFYPCNQIHNRPIWQNWLSVLPLPVTSHALSTPFYFIFMYYHFNLYVFPMFNHASEISQVTSFLFLFSLLLNILYIYNGIDKCK